MNYFEKVKAIVPTPLFEKVVSAYGVQLRTFPASVKYHHVESGWP